MNTTSNSPHSPIAKPLPCPFCGKQPENHLGPAGPVLGHFGSMDDCPIRHRPFTLDEWNRRSSSVLEELEVAAKYEKDHEAAEQYTVKFLKEYVKTLRHAEAVADCVHCQLNYLVSRFIDKHRILDALIGRYRGEKT